MPITLTMPVSGSLTYHATFTAMFAAIQAAINSLESQVSAVGGEAAQLIGDLVDRDGILGSRSYRLDVDAYEGGATILIGYRPEANPLVGDTGISAAWGTFAGVKKRVTLDEDATLNAAGITGGVPKTIYVGIPSDGTPQLYDDTATPNVIYIYSMCWDSYQFTEFVRTAPILTSYDLIRDIAGVQREFMVQDTETDFLVDAESQTSLITPGDAEDNEIGVNGAREICGFFIDFPGDQEDGLDAPAGEDNVLTLKITAEDVDWTEEFEIDASQAENFYQLPIHEDIGRDRFLTEFTRFKLEVVSVGGDVISARNFTWGYYWRPIFGAQIAIDSDKVDLI